MVKAKHARPVLWLLCALLAFGLPLPSAGALSHTGLAHAAALALREGGASPIHAAASAKGEPRLKGSAKKKASDAVPFYLLGIDLVYVTKTGHSYHSIPNCGRTKYPYAITAREAVRLGYDPCDNCEPLPPLLTDEASPLPEGETPVYLIVQDSCYHRNDTCADIQTKDGLYAPVPVTVAEARYLDKTPCKTCKPPKK